MRANIQLAGFGIALMLLSLNCAKETKAPFRSPEEAERYRIRTAKIKTAELLEYVQIIMSLLTIRVLLWLLGTLRDGYDDLTSAIITSTCQVLVIAATAWYLYFKKVVSSYFEKSRDASIPTI
jgi:hypothetical protein